MILIPQNLLICMLLSGSRLISMIQSMLNLKTGHGCKYFVTKISKEICRSFVSTVQSFGFRFKVSKIYDIVTQNCIRFFFTMTFFEQANDDEVFFFS
ncbi:hypothetical protein C2G38_2116106 [Gigaspora rosea]|uniref:Secreted protein n=1 Tax=Gigaspora rosea TaxID=44941 RepID=A0A397U9P2_9GLOM|nr:hypothetical protein C2G38_2116106 [Gigaspora rosea]